MKLADALKTLARQVGTDLYDPEWDGGSWMVNAAETADTLQDFQTNAIEWAERPAQSAWVYGLAGDFDYIYFGACQPKKGEQRRDVWVIDLGEKRFVINANPADYGV